MSRPRLLPIADFTRGIRQNPAFQRGSNGASSDALNIFVDGLGRPVARAGYVVDTELQPQGLGSQLIVVHDLGNSVRRPVSKAYRLFSTQSYVIHKGRIFLSNKNGNNQWVNIVNDQTYGWNIAELTKAPTFTRTPQTIADIREGDGYAPGGKVVSNFFSFAYTFESTQFGFETPLSQARVFDFPTYTGGWYNTNLNYRVYLPHQNIPNWVDRVNFYMQTEPGVPFPDNNAHYNPNGLDKQYMKFGAIRFTNDAQRENFNFAGNPITMQYPVFEWHEGDTAQIPSDNEGSLWPSGRGNYWRAVPTLARFTTISEKKEINALHTLSISGDSLHPIILYAERIWGWDQEEQLLRFSEIGNYDFFPSDYALDLSASGQSEVSALHPAPSTSAFFVFKQDAIHVVRGSGVISGLRMKSIADTDLDASGVILQHGTLSPRTIVSGDNGIYFIGRDRKLKYLTIDGFGTTNIKNIGIAIQEFMNELSEDQLKNLVAFLFNDCYHIIMPGYVLALDIEKRYWTRLDWALTDAFWSEGGIDGESILYAIRSHDSDGKFRNDIVRLFEGATDGGMEIPCEWESQDVLLPFETNVTGVVVQYTGDPQEVSIDLFMDDDLVGEFTGTPERSNRFRIATFGKGHLARVRLKSKDGIPLISALSLEIP